MILLNCKCVSEDIVWTSIDHGHLFYFYFISAFIFLCIFCYAVGSLYFKSVILHDLASSKNGVGQRNCFSRNKK